MSTRNIVLGGLFTAMACVAAMILRFAGPAMVPFSLLPLVVFMAGLLLPTKEAALSMIAYVLLGLAGIPVFAKAPFGGPAYIVQPTFGFLLSFPIAAFVISAGNAIKKRLASVMSLVAGIILIYAIGALYLFVVVNYYMGSPMPAADVVKAAVLPFIGLDVIKAGIALIIARVVAERLREIR